MNTGKNNNTLNLIGNVEIATVNITNIPEKTPKTSVKKTEYQKGEKI